MAHLELGKGCFSIPWKLGQCKSVSTKKDKLPKGADKRSIMAVKVTEACKRLEDRLQRNDGMGLFETGILFLGLSKCHDFQVNVLLKDTRLFKTRRTHRAAAAAEEDPINKDEDPRIHTLLRLDEALDPAAPGSAGLDPVNLDFGRFCANADAITLREDDGAAFWTRREGAGMMMMQDEDDGFGFAAEPAAATTDLPPPTNLFSEEEEFYANPLDAPALSEVNGTVGGAGKENEEDLLMAPARRTAPAEEGEETRMEEGEPKPKRSRGMTALKIPTFQVGAENEDEPPISIPPNDDAPPEQDEAPILDAQEGPGEGVDGAIPDQDVPQEEPLPQEEAVAEEVEQPPPELSPLETASPPPTKRPKKAKAKVVADGEIQIPKRNLQDNLHHGEQTSNPEGYLVVALKQRDSSKALFRPSRMFGSLALTRHYGEVSRNALNREGDFEHEEAEDDANGQEQPNVDDATFDADRLEVPRDASRGGSSIFEDTRRSRMSHVSGGLQRNNSADSGGFQRNNGGEVGAKGSSSDDDEMNTIREEAANEPQLDVSPPPPAMEEDAPPPPEEDFFQPPLPPVDEEVEDELAARLETISVASSDVYADDAFLARVRERAQGREQVLFSEVARGLRGRRAVALAFANLLTLEKEGRVRAEQGEYQGPIQISGF